MERTRTQAAEQGYVETLFGRRLYLPEINSKNGAMRKGAERTAINAPMQGTAADIIKRAMIAVDDWLQDSGLDARVILQVHDELVLEVREDLVEQVREAICPLMSGPPSWTCRCWSRRALATTGTRRTDRAAENVGSRRNFSFALNLRRNAPVRACEGCKSPSMLLVVLSVGRSLTPP